MPWILEFLASNWKAVIFAMLLSALGVQSLRLQIVTTERDEKIAEIASINAAAKAEQARYDSTVKAINDGIPKLVEQEKKNAWKNYLAKYGSSGACGIGRAGGVLPAIASAGQAAGPEGADEAPDQRVFVEGCAHDAGTVILWQDWATRNGLPITE